METEFLLLIWKSITKQHTILLLRAKLNEIWLVFRLNTLSSILTSFKMTHFSNLDISKSEIKWTKKYTGPITVTKWKLNCCMKCRLCLAYIISFYLMWNKRLYQLCYQALFFSKNFIIQVQIHKHIENIKFPAGCSEIHLVLRGT